MHYKRFAAGLLLIAGCSLSCKKEKVDYTYDNRTDTTVGGSSNVRIVNLSGNNQLAINGDSLTSFLIIPPVTGNMDPNYPGTYWFPANGHLGTTFTIPRQFLTSGKATVTIDQMAYQDQRDPISFDVTETYNKPKDYYIVKGTPYTAGAVTRVYEVPRDITTPARAGYFKIRLVNMADQVMVNNNQENVALPLTLAYADGTPVSSTTSGIATHAWSDYIELPYGVYQFKLLTPSGTEVTAVGGDPNENTLLVDPATSQLQVGRSSYPIAVTTGLTYAPVRTFQPGGIYTIAVGISRLTSPYFSGNPGETINFYQNTFRVITDVSEPANTEYYRIQGVQADPAVSQVSFRVNGVKLGDAAYAAHTDYGIYVFGKTTVEAVNANNQVIAVAEQQMAAGLNYTAWLYKKPDGTAAITMVSNNLSGSYYNPGSGSTGQDGSLDMLKVTYPFHIRFLNLCADLPYASFTLDNGQSTGVPTSSSNLQPGIPVLDQPYTRFYQDHAAYQIMVYQSSPTIYPGTWVSSIPVVKSTDFIANPAEYVRGTLPVHEPGVYTVALIGALSGEQQAKMIILKHTK